MSTRTQTLTGRPADDAQLEAIEEMVMTRLRHMLGGLSYVPDELSYIVDEVTIARFNQIGSEGTSSHSVEGESMSWADDLFAPYMDDIETWRQREGDGGRMRVKFI